ncbi:MAG: peptidoglycan DD-metalloendopeptidase family protein [Myxococcales bacterium]|nr:peptidoglycan DD-metalloendopeptidase family protein [Myxococcales bacterium]
MRERWIVLYAACLCLVMSWGCEQATPLQQRELEAKRTLSPAQRKQAEQAASQTKTTDTSSKKKWPPPIRSLLPWLQRAIKGQPKAPPSTPTAQRPTSPPQAAGPEQSRKDATSPQKTVQGGDLQPQPQTPPKQAAGKGTTDKKKADVSVRKKVEKPDDDDSDEAFLRRHQGKFVRVVLRRGDTLERILREKMQIQPGRLRLEIRDELAEFVDLRSIRPGHQLEAVLDKKGRLLRLAFRKDLLNEWWIKVCWRGQRCDESFASKEKSAEDGPGWSLFTQKLEVQERIVKRNLRLRISARTPSVSAGVQQAGEGAELALRVARIFRQHRPIHKLFPGDRLDILFEQIQVAGRVAGYGRLLFARFAPKRERAFYLIHGALLGPKGPEHMYRVDGTRKQSKRFFGPPTRPYHVNSRFGWRYHPVLRRRRLHRGVDVSLPCGRQVFSVAEGRVITRGWRGGAGRMISVRHPRGWVTRYMHLSRYRVRRGQRVRLGQRIGDIGRSGLATGCHLHFEMMRAGRHVDPQRYLRFRPRDEIACSKMTKLWGFQLRACRALGLSLRECGLVLPRRCYRAMRRRFWRMASQACRREHRRCPHAAPKRPGVWPAR